MNDVYLRRHPPDGLVRDLTSQKNDIFYDVEVFCADGTVVNSHRLILGSLSSMLRQPLENNCCGAILAPDADARDLQEFLRGVLDGGEQEAQESLISLFGFSPNTFKAEDDVEHFSDDIVEYEDGYEIEETNDVDPFEDEVNADLNDTDDKGSASSSVLDHPERRDPLENESRFTLHSSGQQKSTRKRRSKIWTFFEEASDNSNKYVCRICGKCIFSKDKRASKLLPHLWHMHPEEFLQVKTKSNCLETSVTAECLNVQGGDGCSTVQDVLVIQNEPDEEAKSTVSRKKRSQVWNFFDRCSDDPDKCICRICGKFILSRKGKISNLWTHLCHVHLELLQQSGTVKRTPSESLQNTEESCTRYVARRRKRSKIWTFFEESVNGKPVCKVCGKIVSDQSSAYMFNHLKSKHKPEHEQFLVLSQEEVKKDPAKETSDRTCDVCSKVLSSRIKMERHRETVHREKKSCSKGCGKIFSSVIRLNEHSCVPKMHLCPVCGETFKHLSGRIQHERAAHAGQKPHACSFCDRRFLFKVQRVRHERTHTGEKPFLCGECGRSFRLETTLKAHTRIHTGETPYECDRCGVKFKHHNSRNRHRLKCYEMSKRKK